MNKWISGLTPKQQEILGKAVIMAGFMAVCFVLDMMPLGLSLLLVLAVFLIVLWFTNEVFQLLAIPGAILLLMMVHIL